MSAKVGSFNITTGAATSTVAVTGVGFTPTVVLFWWSGRTTSTDGAGSANAQMGFGVAKSATVRWALGNHWEDAVATTNTGRRQENDQCIVEVTAAGVAAGAADLVSMDADGFTVVIDTQFTADLRVSYLALGSPHTSVALGSFDPTGTGALSETGLGFSPQCVIFASARLATEADTASADGALSIGVATGATHEWSCSTASSDGDASTAGHAAKYAFGDECSSLAGPVAPAVNQRIELTSLDADGFTVNVLENFNLAVMWVALAGGQYFAGDFVSRADTTQASVTGVGFTPTSLFLASVMAAEHTQDASTANAAMCIGAANSATSRTAQGMTEDDAEAASEIWTAIEHDEMYLRGGYGDDLVGLMDLVSFDADGFTFVMDDADPDAAFIGFLAVGGVPGVFATAAAQSATETTMYRVTAVDAGLVDGLSEVTIAGVQVVKAVTATVGSSADVSCSMFVVRALAGQVDGVSTVVAAGGPCGATADGVLSVSASMNVRYAIGASVGATCETSLALELGASADVALVGKYSKEHALAYRLVKAAGG